MKSIKVLFVCKGNICRSPTAHGVFRDMVSKKGLSDSIQVDSVGTSSRKWGHEKDLADSRSIAMASKFDCDLSDLFSEQLESNHFDEYDYIVAMDQENVDTMKQMFPTAYFTNVSKMLSHAHNIAISDVPDPYYEDNFEQVFLMIDTACHELLKKIKVKHKL